MRKIQARDPVFGPGEIDLALRESARTAAHAGSEDIVNIVSGLAVCVVGAERQLMPELVGAKLKLQAVVVRDASIRALPDDAFVAMDASDRLRYCCLAGRAWRFPGWDKVRKCRGKTRDFRIGIDGLIEPRAMIAHVPRLENSPTNDFALDAQRPLVRLLRFKVGRNTGFIEDAWGENACR